MHFQSSFRPKHSTETALVKVTNDLLLATDSGFLSILIYFLDISADFETISHSVLLDQLACIGVADNALWFSTYLSDRKQFVQIRNAQSESVTVTHGVSQRSVLFSLLFIIYTCGHIFHT